MAKISEVALLSLSPSPTEVLTLLGDSGTEGEGLNRKKGRGARRAGHLLQHISVELLLAVAQELSNHLPAEAFTLEQEMGHSDGGVRDEASGNQELDALVWVSGGAGKGGRRSRE